MRLNNFIEGLTVLQRHYLNPNGYHMSAEHDEICFASTDLPLSAEDFQKMRTLGWFQPGYGASDEYHLAEGWKAFV